ncbi:MAG: PPOX class F420-dependent oxidoreductase [Chloroflexi bacterium]|nr:PPOX class F420-dependent oxidoreductase [Chloroflexota bacterium]
MDYDVRPYYLRDVYDHLLRISDMVNTFRDVLTGMAGGHILINTAEGRLKTRNVARDARVAVSVVDGQNTIRFVSVRGAIAERRHEGAAEHLDFLAKKYTDRERYDYRGRVEQRVILRIRPHHVLERGM